MAHTSVQYKLHKYILGHWNKHFVFWHWWQNIPKPCKSLWSCFSFEFFKIDHQSFFEPAPGWRNKISVSVSVSVNLPHLNHPAWVTWSLARSNNSEAIWCCTKRMENATLVLCTTEQPGDFADSKSTWPAVWNSARPIKLQASSLMTPRFFCCISCRQACPWALARHVSLWPRATAKHKD